jgi:hypothetical protein
MTSVPILAPRFLFAPRGLLNERHESFASKTKGRRSADRRTRSVGLPRMALPPTVRRRGPY